MPTLQDILDSCSHHLPICHQQKVVEIDQKLAAGTPYTQLGGKRIRQCPSIVRFKIGRDYRFVYFLNNGVLKAHCLITRQRFDQLLKRRRKHN